MPRPESGRIIESPGLILVVPNDASIMTFAPTKGLMGKGRKSYCFIIGYVLNLSPVPTRIWVSEVASLTDDGAPFACRIESPWGKESDTAFSSESELLGVSLKNPMVVALVMILSGYPEKVTLTPRFDSPMDIMEEDFSAAFAAAFACPAVVGGIHAGRLSPNLLTLIPL